MLDRTGDWPRWNDLSPGNFYEQARTFTDQQLAWEFLRRSEAYRRDWAAYYVERKSRAYMYGENLEKVAAMAREIGDRYHLAPGEEPPDPFGDRVPRFAEGIAVKGDVGVDLLSASDGRHVLPFEGDHLALGPTITLRFRLDLPLAAQFKAAFKWVGYWRDKWNIPEPAARLRAPGTSRDRLLPRYLRILDAKAEKGPKGKLLVTAKEIAAVVLAAEHPDQGDQPVARVHPSEVQRIKESFRRAQEIADGGYFLLLTRNRS